MSTKTTSPPRAIIKSIISTVLYVGIFSGLVACLYNVFLTTENDLTAKDPLCQGGYIGFEYDFKTSSFQRANMTTHECLDRFAFQHTLLYRHSFSVEVSLWTSFGFTVAALLFILLSAVCNRQCYGWQTFGGHADPDEHSQKGACESALFCCGSTQGMGDRPKFSWARRAVFLTLSGAAIICLGISLSITVIVFSQESQFVPQVEDASRSVILDEEDSAVRRVDNLKALISLHVIAMLFKVGWIFAIDDDQQTNMHIRHINMYKNHDHLKEHDQHFSQHDNRLNKHDQRLGEHDDRLNNHEQQMDEMDTKMFMPTKKIQFRNQYKSNRSFIRNQLNY